MEIQHPDSAMLNIKKNTFVTKLSIKTHPVLKITGHKPPLSSGGSCWVLQSQTLYLSLSHATFIS